MSWRIVWPMPHLNQSSTHLSLILHIRGHLSSPTASSLYLPVDTKKVSKVKKSTTIHVPDSWKHIGQLSEACVRSQAVIAINSHACIIGVWQIYTVPH